MRAAANSSSSRYARFRVALPPPALVASLHAASVASLTLSRSSLHAAKAAQPVQSHAGPPHAAAGQTHSLLSLNPSNPKLDETVRYETATRRNRLDAQNSKQESQFLFGLRAESTGLLLQHSPLPRTDRDADPADGARDVTARDATASYGAWGLNRAWGE